MNDKDLARRIRAELPLDAFRIKRTRVLIAIPLIAGIAGLSTMLVSLPLRRYVAIPLAILLGNFYVSLFFFGHEVGHGAVTRSRLLRKILMYLALAVLMISPRLWDVWHNRVHHRYTNRAGHDPDNFGDLDSFFRYPAMAYFINVGPGSGHWLSIIYFPTWLTIFAQGVLWIKSRQLEGFSRLDRTRAAADSLIMAAIWIALGAWLGAWHAFIVIVIPMMTVNTVALSYISTNHLLRPQVDHGDVLASSMSVTTYRLLDWIHFHFSHHVEHHLFPSLSAKYAPMVKAALCKHAGDRYLAPPRWRALLLLFRTPRVYEGTHTLVDPLRRRRVKLAQIEEALRCGRTRVAVENDVRRVDRQGVIGTWTQEGE